MNNDLKTLENEFKDVQNKQQQQIIQSASLQLNLTATTNNLANKLESLKNELSTVQTKQKEIINRDINILRSNLTATTNNLANRIDVVDQNLSSTQEKQLELTSDVRDHDHANKQRLDQLTSHINQLTNEFKLIDQQIGTVQQKQIELSRLGEENDQKMNTISTNLTDGMNRLDEKLNSTQKKQLELTSDVRSHGYGNKQRIDQLTSQITNFTSDFDVFNQQVSTNITFYLNQIERQAFENITDLSSQMNSTTKKMDVLWFNLLNSLDMVVPILENFTIYAPAADIIEKRYRKNVTLENAIRSAMDEIYLNVVETVDFKRIVTDHIRFQPNDIKLHPIDSNLKKVKHSFTVESFARNKLYFT